MTTLRADTPSHSKANHLLARFELVWTLGLVACAMALRLVPFVYFGLSRPITLGGLYVHFGKEIGKHHFLLPKTIPFYTDGGIPFAYPPLPFYFFALFRELVHYNDFVLMNIQAGMQAALTVAVFYWMVRSLLRAPLERFCALLAFTFLDASYYDFLSGAGIAESAGAMAVMLLVITAMWCRTGGFTRYILLGVVWAFSAFASPGSLWMSGPLVLAMSVSHWATDPFAFWRLVRSYGSACIIAIAVSSIWWGTVIHYHGTSVYTRVASGESHDLFHHQLDRLLQLEIQMPFTYHRYGVLWGVMAVAGVIICLHRRRLDLPGLLIAAALTPREYSWLVGQFAPLLIGVGAATIVPWAISGIWTAWSPRWLAGLIAAGIGWVIVLNLAYDSLRGVRDLLRTPEQHVLSAASIDAAAWLHDHVGASTKLVVLVNGDEDQTIEWMPTLAEREVLNVRYGAEWEPSELAVILDFNKEAQTINDLSALDAAVHRHFNVDQYMIVTNNAHFAHSAAVQDGSWTTPWSHDDLTIYAKTTH
ncbi:MAG: hypothetical protein GC162_17765 [Planctomycetes bacterium]|nr:hypothetical protein [Planctomycetota bacterium]